MSLFSPRNSPMIFFGEVVGSEGQEKRIFGFSVKRGQDGLTGVKYYQTDSLEIMNCV